MGLQAVLHARRQRLGLPILVLSQYVEQLYANELLAGGHGAIGCLLKDRVTNTEQFVDAVRRVAAGGTVMDPHVIVKLLSSSEARGTISSLTPRERDVLELMAEGRSNHRGGPARQRKRGRQAHDRHLRETPDRPVR